MSKGGGKSSPLAPVAGSAVGVLQRVVLGALCGVGLVWTLTAVWPPCRSYVSGLGHHIGRFSIHNPVVLLGLLLGVFGSLLWSAVKK